MKSKLLTLAISEMKPTTSKVVTYDLDEHIFKPVIVDKSKFIVNNKMAWDLFGVTEARLSRSNYGFYFPQGQSEVVDYYDKNSMIKFFNENKTLSPDFVNQTNPYGIVAADELLDIAPPKLVGDKYSAYVGYRSRAKSYPKVLVKDLRWLSYWKHNHLNKPDGLQEKIEQWKLYINAPQRHRSLILYYSSELKRGWVCGFHCL